MVDEIASNIVQVRGAVAPLSSSSSSSSSCVSNRLSESSSNINSKFHSSGTSSAPPLNIQQLQQQQQQQQQRVSLIEESKANATSPVPNESPFPFASASSLVSPSPVSRSGNNKPSVVVLVAPAPPSSSSSSSSPLPSSAVARVVTLESLSPDVPAGNSNPNRDRVVPFADPSVVEFSALESTFQRESCLANSKAEASAPSPEKGVPQVEDDDEDDDVLFETLSSHYLSDLASLDLPLGIGFADQVDRISDSNSNSNSSASSSPAPVVEDRSCEKRKSLNSTPATTASNFRQVAKTTNSKKYPVASNHSQRQRKKHAKAEANSNSTIIASNIMSDSHPSAMRPTLVPTPLLPSPESSPAPAPVAAVPPIAPVGAATASATTAPTTPSQNPAPGGAKAPAASTTGPAPSTAYPLPHRPPPAAAKPPASSQPPSQPQGQGQGHSRPPAPSAANTTPQTSPPAAPPATTHPSYHPAPPPPHPSSHLQYPPHAHSHPRPVTAGLPPISIPGNAPAAASTPRAAPSVKPSAHPNHHHGDADSPDSRSAVAENTGRWTAEEHRLFLQGLEQHGKGWKKIAGLIKSRTVVQIRTHAQKYFQKLAKARQNGEGASGGLVVGGELSPHGGGDRSGVSVMHGATAAMTLTTSTMGAGGVPAAATAHGYGLSTAVVDGTAARGATTGAAMLPASTSAQATAARARAGGNAGNMAMGTDPTSLAVAAAGLAAIQGTSAATPANGAASMSQAPGKRRRGPPTGTKRRAIGSVVRSAVREGRNVKRQKIAEARRNGGGPAAEGVVNPLPAISNILDPYVAGAAAAQAQTSATGSGGGNNGKNARGRNQLVQTATHGTLPMASLEDAVFRLLTPATGAPAPQLPTGPPAAPSSIVDPLAPNPVRPHSLTHTNYGVTNSSPTCVADISTYPSWVDANNPPQWYNDGSDIDKLLEEADCLNWLDDTGDFDENYVPPPSDMDFNIDPTSVTSHSHESQHNAAVPTPEDDHYANMSSTYAETPSLLSADGTATEPQPTAVKMEEDVATEPTMIHAGGVVHPSGESLSFLVDEETEANHLPLQGFVDHAQDTLGDRPPATLATPYSSATEAVEAHDRDGKFHRDESHGGLMSFPDLGMGDEQAFVSALLEDNGQNSTISFPKFHSDLGVHLSNGQSGIGLSSSSEAHVKEEMP